MRINLDPEAWSPSSARNALRPEQPKMTYADGYVLARMTATLREKYETTAKAVTTGVGDYPTYRELVGELRATEFALDALARVQRESNQGGEAAEPKDAPLYE